MVKITAELQSILTNEDQSICINVVKIEMVFFLEILFFFFSIFQSVFSNETSCHENHILSGYEAGIKIIQLLRTMMLFAFDQPANDLIQM